MNRLRVVVSLFICLAGLSAKSLAQNTAQNTLNSLAQTLGASNLKTLQYSGSGSSYIVTDGPVPVGGWAHSVMKSYIREIDLAATTSRLQLIRAEGTPAADKTLRQAIDGNSLWSLQYSFWLTPYTFLKGALAHNATVEQKTVFGTTYRAVTFTLPGNHKVVGYINDKDLIEKIETRVGDEDDVLVEASYRDYANFGGVMFPTLITEKHGGELSLILVVKEVRVTN
jgi:hypothetical protein